MRPISVRKDEDGWRIYDLKGGLMHGWPPRPVYTTGMCCWRSAMSVASALQAFYRGHTPVPDPRLLCEHGKPGGGPWF
jgi:hypothetical protein